MLPKLGQILCAALQHPEKTEALAGLVRRLSVIFEQEAVLCFQNGEVLLVGR